MEVHNLADFIRLANLVGCLLLMTVLLVKARRNWSRYTSTGRNLWWAYFGWPLAAMYGSAEILFGWAEVRPMVVLGVLVLGLAAQFSKESITTDGGELDAGPRPSH